MYTYRGQAGPNLQGSLALNRCESSRTGSDHFIVPTVGFNTGVQAATARHSEGVEQTPFSKEYRR